MKMPLPRLGFVTPDSNPCRGTDVGCTAECAVSEVDGNPDAGVGLFRLVVIGVAIGGCCRDGRLGVEPGIEGEAAGPGLGISRQ